MTNEEDALARIVAERNVAFEIWPDQEVVDGEIVSVGFRVELVAPSKHAEGCPHVTELACPAVFADLALVAQAVLPSAVRDSAYFLDAFDHSLHIEPSRHFEHDVQLTIRVRHRDASRGPIDACERECARDIANALLHLGAQRRH